MVGRILIISVVAGIAAVLYGLVARQDNHEHWQPVLGRNNTVLFVTADHPGLFNVHLATAYSLLENHPQIKVHYASFPRTAEAVERISNVAAQQGVGGERIIFHTLDGISYMEALTSLIDSEAKVQHEPGLPGIDFLASIMQFSIAPWSAEDYWYLYEKLTEIIDNVDPSVVVIDTVFHPGVDAARNKRRLHALVTPNILSDLLPAQQPTWTLLWKYPALGSGFPYPVPWSLIPANIYMNFRMIRAILSLPDVYEKRTWLEKQGISNAIDFMGLYKPYMPWITQTLPGAHLPMVQMPANVSLTGPINLAGVEEETASGRDLLDWVQRGKTVLISLGSGYKYNETTARIMLQAIENVLVAAADVQVLWKMHKRDDFDSSFIDQAVKNASNRLRVERWLEIEPPTLLQSGHIVASVHHGGAGCYHDALGAGIPQLILPMWIDLYDIAQIAESIGVGLWACRENNPNWTAECIQQSLLSILHESPASASLAKTAAAYGDLAKSMGRGRDTSARMIAELAGSGRS